MGTNPIIRFPEFTTDWEEKKIGDILQICHGKDYKHLNKGKYPVLGTSGIFEYVDDYMCDWACAMIGRKGATLDRPHYMDTPFWCVDTLFYSKPKKNQHPKFQYYLFHTISWMNYNEASGMPSLRASTIEDIDIKVPTYEEQKKISEFFSAIDQKITEQEETIKTLLELKTGTIQKILSKKHRFKKDNGDNFSEWKKLKLQELLVERKETAEKDGSYEHISLTKEGVVPKSERYERDFLVTSDDKKYKVTHYNDICYNPANLKFGVICRNKYGDGIFSPIYITFETTQLTTPEFMEIILTRNDFINYSMKYQQGTVYERMSVSPEDMLSIEIELPELAEQEKIIKLISTLDRKIDAEKQLLTDYEELKKGLLQKMFA